MIILHIASIGNNKSSGLLYAIPPLVYYQNKVKNINSALLITSKQVTMSFDKFNFPIYKFDKKEIKFDLSGLPSPYNCPDLVIFHSTYLPIHIKIASELRKRKIPYIITPHGGMTKGAQSKKKFKKKLGNILFYNRFVDGAIALHCLTKGEAEETEGWNKKIFVVGNGMDLPRDFNYEYEKEENPIRFTFIGRLDIYPKGLDLLLGGIAKVSETIRKSNSKFCIYGPDISGSKKILEKFINDYKIQDIVQLFGPIFDKDKHEVLMGTDVFVHTSRFEGHPMGVLEAMAYGIPCLLTPGTNISNEVVQEDAGWEVDATEKSIAEGIKIIIDERKKIREKGLNARRLISERYTWNNVAIKTINEYYNLLKNKI